MAQLGIRTAERTVLDIIEHICGSLYKLNPLYAPHRSLIRLVEDKQGHEQRYAIQTSKIRSLGWKAKHNIETLILNVHRS
ncbi:hypothetical protein AKJ18_04785 [Vibrio xuii]|nr:hypothetical protein AKJ18_04785 [Vibrio xuii]